MYRSIKTAVCGILIAGTGIGCSMAAPQTGSAQSGERHPIPVLVVVPAIDGGRSAQNPHDGCWVRLMDNVDKVKGNEYMTIFGSKYMPNLKTASGEDWARKMDGINTGPEAVLTVFDEPAYRGHGIILRPNQVVQDFRKDLGFANAIESMKVDCKA